MVTEAEFFPLVEHKVLEHGTVQSAEITVTGRSDGSYKLRYAALKDMACSDKASLVHQIHAGAYFVVRMREIRKKIDSESDDAFREAMAGVHTWLIPSRNTEDYWVHAHSSRKDYPQDTERSGKWLLFVPTPDVDAHWENVLRALDTKALGDSAKVSTARRNPHELNPNERVICVYTYDADDYGDVSRVRQALRDIGYTRKLPYKLDDTTLAGRYSTSGRVSRYYE